MIVTPGVVDTLRARSRTITTMRRMLEERGFLEVGASAVSAGRWGRWRVVQGLWTGEQGLC